MQLDAKRHQKKESSRTVTVYLQSCLPRLGRLHSMAAVRTNEHVERVSSLQRLFEFLEIKAAASNQ